MILIFNFADHLFDFAMDAQYVLELVDYLMIVGVGVIAGFINVLAASGSMLVLPLLIFLGLPPTVANGTNRVAILLQNIVAVASFKKQQLISVSETKHISISSLIGAIAGAFVAVEISDKYLNYTIATLLLVMFAFLIFKPQVWIQGKAPDAKAMSPVWQCVAFFFIGVYGGFIQAGVGMFLLAGLVLGVGQDLLRANAAKVLITLIYTPVTMLIFLWSGLIDWKAGLVLAIGSMTGAFFASKYAKRIGAGFIRYLLMVVLAISALKMFGVLEYFFS